MRSILSGIVAAVLIAALAGFVLQGGVQQSATDAYQTSGARI